MVLEDLIKLQLNFNEQFVTPLVQMYFEKYLSYEPKYGDNRRDMALYEVKKYLVHKNIK